MFFFFRQKKSYDMRIIYWISLFCSSDLICLAVMLVLAFARMPIAFVMMIVGFFGFAFIVNWAASLAMIAQVAYDTGLSYEMTVVPLFILMGAFVTRAARKIVG